jgi:hypothetical protein
MHAIPGWQPTIHENIHKLQRIQNRASRLIFSKNCNHKLDNKIMSVKSYLYYTDLLYFHNCRNSIIDCNVNNDIRIINHIAI